MENPKQQKPKEATEKETKNNCNAKNEWLVKWLFRLLIISIFVMCCIMTHYLLKLWEVWKVVERMPKP